MKQLNAKRFAFFYFTFIILLGISSLYMKPVQSNEEGSRLEKSQTTAQNELLSDSESMAYN